MPWLDRAGPRRAVVAGLAVAAAATSLLVGHHVVPLQSGNLDEGVYRFQAEMLLDGQVALPADRYGEFFRPWLSGEREGRIFTEYQVGFAALLAASERALGSMRAGLAVVAAANVVAVHGMAQAWWRDRRAAIWATGLVALSPLFVLHSALLLTYVATTALVAGFAWAALAAVDRRGSGWRAAVAGLLLGGALLIRPLDAALAALPIGALVVHRARRGGVAWRRLSGLTGVGLLAAVPALAVTAWYNARTTGSPTRFPNMAADELNRFGFGVRRLVEGEPVIEYRLSHALGALRRNLWAVPSWALGGPLLLLAAAWGALRRGCTAERLALVGLAVAFPLVYLFWWATRLSALDVTNGIGPHYYFPTFLALALLGARGIVDLARGDLRRHAAIGVALAVATAWAVPDKLDEQRRVTAEHRAAAEAIPDDLSDAVVVIDHGRPYLLSRHPFLVTDPSLDGDVVFAIDRGERNRVLAELFPGRAVHRLVPPAEPGGTYRLVCELPETC